MTSALVSTDWLDLNYTRPDIKIIDSSCFPPNITRDAKSEYAKAHLPGAVFFDINAIADSQTDLPHMLPSADFFAACVSELGISSSDTVIAYDSMGIFGAARAWWMFRAMGHDNVFVLDGGLPRWLEDGRETTASPPTLTKGHFVARYRPELVRAKDQVLANITTKADIVLDARSAGRFSGQDPEPWTGRRCGHIPGALNVPFSATLTAQQTMKSPAELHALLANIPADRKPVASCGSGVSACVLALALHEAGRPDCAVYDGSWAEWGLETSGCPIETGALSSAG